MMCFRIDFFGFTLPDISSLALTCSSLFYFAKFGKILFAKLLFFEYSFSFTVFFSCILGLWWYKCLFSCYWPTSFWSSVINNKWPLKLELKLESYPGKIGNEIERISCRKAWMWQIRINERQCKFKINGM